MISLTPSLDKKIAHCMQQSRGWSDVAHNEQMAMRWYEVTEWFIEKRNQRLKAIFGS